MPDLMIWEQLSLSHDKDVQVLISLEIILTLGA